MPGNSGIVLRAAVIHSEKAVPLAINTPLTISSAIVCGGLRISLMRLEIKSACNE